MQEGSGREASRVHTPGIAVRKPCARSSKRDECPDRMTCTGSLNIIKRCGKMEGQAPECGTTRRRLAQQSFGSVGRERTLTYVGDRRRTYLRHTTNGRSLVPRTIAQQASLRRRRALSSCAYHDQSTTAVRGDRSGDAGAHSARPTSVPPRLCWIR